MKKITIKILVTLLCLFIAGSTTMIYVRAGGTNLISNDRMPILVYIAGVSIAVAVVMWLPEDIKSYPTGKKILIGSLMGIIFIVLIMAFFLLSVFVF